MSTDPTKKKDEHVSTSQALDDEQRVKVLSPGMLVAKTIFPQQAGCGRTCNSCSNVCVLICWRYGQSLW